MCLSPDVFWNKNICRRDGVLQTRLEQGRVAVSSSRVCKLEVRGGAAGQRCGIILVLQGSVICSVLMARIAVVGHSVHSGQAEGGGVDLPAQKLHFMAHCMVRINPGSKEALGTKFQQPVRGNPMQRQKPPQDSPRGSVVQRRIHDSGSQSRERGLADEELVLPTVTRDRRLPRDVHCPGRLTQAGGL